MDGGMEERTDVPLGWLLDDCVLPDQMSTCPVLLRVFFENVNLVRRDDELLIVSFFLNYDSNSFISFLPSSQKEKKNM